MLDFDRKKLSYTPRKINEKDTASSSTETQSLKEAVAVAEKLLAHLEMIQEYRDRIDAVDYLINNADKLSGNIRYDISDERMQRAVKALGFNGSYIDFIVFKEAVATLVQAYKEIALIELTGVRDEQ